MARSPTEARARTSPARGKGFRSLYESAGKSKSGSKDRGKGKDKSGKDKGGKPGAGRGGSPYSFDGYCSYCEKFGHKRAECRKRLSELARGKGSSTAAVETYTPDQRSTSAVERAVPWDDQNEYYDSDLVDTEGSWVMAAERHLGAVSDAIR